MALYIVCALKLGNIFRSPIGKYIFAEAGTKNSMQFYIKRKDGLFRSRNRLPKITFVFICFNNSKSQNGAPNWPNFQNVECMQ